VITTVIRHNVPDAITGSILGLSTSAQFAGQVSGPLAGGFIGGRYGMRAVFFATSALMLLGGAGNWIISKARPGINTGQAAGNISSNAGEAITPIPSVNRQPTE